MRKILLVLFTVCSCVAAFGQSTTSLAGMVKDASTGSPLQGATITLQGGSKPLLSNTQGQFQWQGLAAGIHRLTVTYVGYQPFTKEVVLKEGETTHLEVVLLPDTRPGDEVVVSAFLKPEKMYEAAAAIQVVDRKTFERFAGSNPLELLASVPGLEYTRTGVDDITFNARGLHSAFNNRVLQIIDGRNSMSSLSASLPVMNRSTVIKDDIERIEVVLGPQSAIYGPNAHNAVFHFLTKDPRKYSGTSLSTSAGSRSQFSTRLRHAHVISNRWAYKITGEHAAGKEFEFYDSVYAGNQTGATPFYGPAVAIPERVKDFSFRHVRGEASLYYTLKEGTDLVLSGGSSEHTWPQVTTAGRNQMKGVIFSFMQARLVSARWYASIYNTWGSLGESYNLGNYTREYWNRTHSTLPGSDPARGRLSPDSAETNALRSSFRERSQRLNAELRYNHTITRAGLFIAACVNYQEERPNGYGLTLVDSARRIYVRQMGIALQAEKVLPLDLRMVVATRFDHHQNFGPFLSPRIGLVKPVRQGAFRISWSRAYSMPSIQNQYAAIGRNLFGNGGGILYIPNEQLVSNEAARTTTTPLQPERISTWEAGFKGNVAKNLYLDVNTYYGISRNFISPSRTVGGRVIAVNGIPVAHSPNTAGTVRNDTLKGASFSTFFNYGEVTAYGADIALRYAINGRLNLLVNYSWFGSDITRDDLRNDANKDNYVSLEERTLNAPRHRGLLALQAERILNQRWNASITARFVEQYDFYSGSQIGTAEGKGRRGFVAGPLNPNGTPRIYVKNFNHGPLGGFVTVDLTTGYDFTDNLRINMGVTNLFDTGQVEFVASPSIGRLVMLELRLKVW